MSGISHQRRVEAPPPRVFQAITDPAMLDCWWTERSSGRPETGETYELGFGPGYRREAVVGKASAPEEFELELTRGDGDWEGTRVGFQLTRFGAATVLDFYHTGWAAENDHFRISSFCWAMYVRLMKRYVETGEVVP